MNWWLHELWRWWLELIGRRKIVGSGDDSHRDETPDPEDNPYFDD